MPEQSAKEYIEQWIYEYYSGKQLVHKLRQKLSDEQIVCVLEVLENTCQYCYGESPCSCWNDD